jgi:hypothetical protein
MKKIKKKLTAMLNAVTFAEAGEHGTAIECLGETIDEETLNTRILNQEFSEATGNANLVSRAGNQMVAATFAEAGEFGTALEILRTRRRSKTVLFVSDGDNTESDAFDYAVNLCRRMEAALEVVALAGEKGEDDVSTVSAAADERLMEMSRIAAQHGVPSANSALPGNSDKNLLDYIRRHKEISAVIYGSHDHERNVGRQSGLLSVLETIVEKFSIPLITVLRKQST